MNADFARNVLRNQFEATLCMFNECVVSCPEAHWDSKIAKYPIWHVVYHVLCFVDLLLTPDEKQFKTGPMHPRGMAELDDEYPSRRFEKSEMLEYLSICRRKLEAVMPAETEESLAGPSGHGWLKFSRAELYVYSIRHIQHHTGQLSAFLRRVDVDAKWYKSGWPA